KAPRSAAEWRVKRGLFEERSDEFRSAPFGEHRREPVGCRSGCPLTCMDALMPQAHGCAGAAFFVSFSLGIQRKSDSPAGETATQNQHRFHSKFRYRSYG